MNSILLAAALLLGYAQAGEFYVQTEVFSTPDFHQNNVLDRYSRGGLIAGWILYGVIVVVSFVFVFKATLERSKEYDQNLVDARTQMRNLGINVEEADREFDELQKGHVKVEEQVDLIEVALQEGKKIRETKGDNRI